VQRLFRLLAVIAFLLIGGVVVANPAFAHDELLSTSPEANATLAEPPARITLTFAEAPLKDTTKIVARAADNSEVPLPPAIVTEATAQTPWPQDAPVGTYTIAWRNVGDDGHVLTGEFSFTYGVAASASPTVSGAASATTGAIPTTSTSQAAASPIDTGDSSTLWIIPTLGGIAIVAAGITGLALQSRRGKKH